jgi:hypothetical protein
MSTEVIPAVCPVCNCAVAVRLFDGGNQTLATLGWPTSAEDAQAMPKYPHDFVQCPKCTHVWNKSFSYEVIPYHTKPNRMFNNGTIWQGHLAKTRDAVIARFPNSPTFIDIGCGEGHFVREIAQAYQKQGRFVGFDPNVSAESGLGVEFHARYFDSFTDMAAFAPDAIAIRHVLEHLTNPAQLIEHLAWGAALMNKTCWLFAEVPCIDRVFKSGRIADFFYEHVSHFTTSSFEKLMLRAGDIVELDHGYNGEVVCALVKLHVPVIFSEQVKSTNAFANQAKRNRSQIQSQLEKLFSSHQRVAIWGGTGKAAAFIHQFGADRYRFPLVVDSDRQKVGTYVPGSGQKILYRDDLKLNMPDVIIIPTQWRAKDIVAEMVRESIAPKQVLIEHQGWLIDFATDEHPYR